MYAQTEVGAVSESQIPSRAALEVECFRLVECARVPIGSRHEKQHSLPCSHALAPDHHVPLRGPDKPACRGVNTQELLDRCGYQGGVRRQPVTLCRFSRKPDNNVAECV